MPSRLELSSINARRAANYIISKKGRDGGYLTYQYRGIFDSSVDDTYYAIKSLKLLGLDPPEPEKTISFLRSIQRDDGGYPSIEAAYYAIKGLSELGDRPEDPRGASDYLMLKLRNALRRKEKKRGMSKIARAVEELHPKIEGGVLKSWDLTEKLYNIEISSRLSDLHMIAEALEILGRKIDHEEKVKSVVLLYRMQDGGFGLNYSSIDETFYALVVFEKLGCDVEKLGDTAAWVKECEDPLGGFRVMPSVKRAYLLSHLYYGLMSMRILRLKPKYVQQHLEFIMKCANYDGGFRNSVHIGLSSLEATFYALSSLAMLTGEGS
ncbi:MAG: prenyltransferase/squalene oxidase repeat-containing protein [Nitrososphaerota archaeon]